MAPIPGEDAEVMIEMTAKNLEYDISLIDKAVAGFERILKVWLRVTGFSDGSVGKESACNAGDRGDSGSESERSPGEETTTHSNILAWKIPWTEEPGCPKGHKELNTTEQPSTQCGLNAINQHCMLQRNHSWKEESICVAIIVVLF